MGAVRNACAVVILLLVCATHAPAQPPVPQWLKDINPADYALIQSDLPAGMKVDGDIDAQASVQALGIKDAAGNVSEQQSQFFVLTETLAVTEGDDSGWASIWVAVSGTRAEAEALARQPFANYGMNPDWMVNGNDLGDRRIPPNGGSVAGPNKVMICYQSMLAVFGWQGAIGDFSERKLKEVALLWLNKVAGPIGADLRIVPKDHVFLKLSAAHKQREREAAADKQQVLVYVINNSADVTAKDVQVRVSVRREEDAQHTPIAEVKGIGDVAPQKHGHVAIPWDLKGENLANAELLVEAWSTAGKDLDPRDNQCTVPCSIYYAHNGSRAYRWRADSYAFNNYTFKGRELQELVEGILATAVGQMGTDARTYELLSHLLLPQTYMRLFGYLGKGIRSGAGGHCYGMSATAGLYFMDPSLRPVAADASRISQDDASANINLYQRAQMVPLAQALLSGDAYFERNWGAMACLNTVRHRLRAQRQPVLLSLRGTMKVQKQVTVNGQPQMQEVEEWWGHAVLAYKLMERPGRLSAIYVYDPNLPPAQQWDGDEPMSALYVDRNSGLFTMTSDLAAKYDRDDFKLRQIAAREITREVSVAESNAIVPVLRSSLQEVAEFLAKADELIAALQCPADVVFTDAEGRRVGHADGAPVNEVPGAEIRTDGEVEIYLLPADAQYRVQVTGTGTGQSTLDIIKPGADGALELVSFGDLPTTAGAQFVGTLSHGRIESLDGQGGAHGPTLSGAVDTKTWAPPVITDTPPGGEPAEYHLDSAEASFAWDDDYPNSGGTLSLSYRCLKPGTILDTVGINAAKGGDFTLRQLDDGTLSWQIFNPRVAGASRDKSGWHRLVSQEKPELGKWHHVEAGWGPGGMRLSIDGVEAAVDPVVLALSGNPLFIGDYPGDSRWAPGLNVHLSMVGDVKDLRFSP